MAQGGRPAGQPLHHWRWRLGGLALVAAIAGGTALLWRAPPPVTLPPAPPGLAPSASRLPAAPTPKLPAAPPLTTPRQPPPPPAAAALPTAPAAAPPATLAAPTAPPPAPAAALVAPVVAVPAAPAAPPAAPAATAAAVAPRLADEAAILADEAKQMTVFRFAPAPSVVVLDFPSLIQQGHMLNRVAALVEKAGLPRDRVLTDAELAEAIRREDETEATYYYGHDYAASSLVRFFALADRDHVALNPSEQRLRALVAQFGWFGPDPHGALLSVSREGADAEITPAARAAILHHELSHGIFFSDPAYAGYVRAFWRAALTREERDAVRTFLGSEDYDTEDEDLMANEMQAYLMFTGDPHFFLPSNVSMTPARRADLQAAFWRGLPDGWARAAMLGGGDAPSAALAAAPVISAPPPPAAMRH